VDLPRASVSVTWWGVSLGRHNFSTATQTWSAWSLTAPLRMGAPIAQHAAASRQRLTIPRPSSYDRCSPPCRSISRSNRKQQGEATSRRGIQAGRVISGYGIYSFFSHRAYCLPKFGTSRYHLRARGRQSQPSLRMASLRVHVRTAHPEIASGGNVQIQCPIPRMILNTLGRWMKVHLQGTLAVENWFVLSPRFRLVVN